MVSWKIVSSGMWLPDVCDKQVSELFGNVYLKFLENSFKNVWKVFFYLKERVFQRFVYQNTKRELIWYRNKLTSRFLYFLWGWSQPEKIPM